ncbi:tyrosine-type recombinase/integrase [Nocardia wallacei]|uniref:tyrosine-type recombinase/integrase n=1 Tax=Nocardia wallacei TaxID=480035 RepID=UPI0024546B51|nr:site-specific integrase [Nocardia wallacei]
MLELASDFKLLGTPLPVSWTPVLAKYELALKASGLGKGTVRLRVAHMRRLARCIGRHTAVPGVTSDQLLTWVARQVWQQETRRSYYVSFRKFWSWACGVGLTNIDAAADLPVIEPTDPAPRPASWDAYRAVLMSAPRRERLMLRLSAECGMRRAEVAQAHSRDLSKRKDGLWILVHGKGGRTRWVPVPADLAEELLNCGRGYFFPNHRHPSGHLSADYVGKRVSAMLDDYTMHQLRHMFADRTYEVKKDLFVVQQLLGHRKPETTRRYVLVRSADLRATVETVAYT